MTQTQQLPARQNNGALGTIKNLFETAKDRLAEVAPKHVTPDRLMRVALLTISKTPDLARCTPMSLLNSFMTASQLGLEIGGTLGEAYLVPYKNEATFIVGYRGLINLARRSGHVQSVEAQVVRAGDAFEYEYGINPIFRHKPGSTSGGRITHAWALARFKDGGFQIDVMTLDEVEAIRNRSRAKSGPWQTDFAEMAKKTVVRRLCKYLPLSPEMADAIDASDRGEFGDFVDGQVVEQAEKQQEQKRQKKVDRLADMLDVEPVAAVNGDEEDHSHYEQYQDQEAAAAPAAPAPPAATPAPPAAQPRQEPAPADDDESDDEQLRHVVEGPKDPFVKLLRDKAKDNGVAQKQTFEHGVFLYCQARGVGSVEKLGSPDKWALYEAVCSNEMDWATGKIKDA